MLTSGQLAQVVSCLYFNWFIGRRRWKGCSWGGGLAAGDPELRFCTCFYVSVC